MCVELRTLSSCGCQTIQINICLEYVNHTHRQVDNKPCPKFKLLQSAVKHGCRAPGTPCKLLSNEKYTFEQAGESLSSAMNRASKKWAEDRRAKKEAFKVGAKGKEEVKVRKRVKMEDDEDSMKM